MEKKSVLDITLINGKVYRAVVPDQRLKLILESGFPPDGRLTFSGLEGSTTIAARHILHIFSRSVEGNVTEGFL